MEEVQDKLSYEFRMLEMQLAAWKKLAALAGMRDREEYGILAAQWLEDPGQSHVF